MQNINYLQRPKPLPRCIAYVKRNLDFTRCYPVSSTKADLYNMADTKTGKFVGHMYTRILRDYENDRIYPFVKKCDSLYIEELKIKKEHRRKGYGTQFIKLAVNESKAENCNGRVHLVATAAFDLHNPSHVFYRKKGFKTTDSSINARIDMSVADGKYRRFQSMYMYLPIGDKRPVNKITKIKNFIVNLFNTRKEKL